MTDVLSTDNTGQVLTQGRPQTVVTFKDTRLITVENTDREVLTNDTLAEVLTIGVPGPPGINGDKHFSYEQNVPASNWLVTHNLDKHPSVTITDSAGTSVDGCVVYVDKNTVSLTFSAAFSGLAYFN